MPPPCSSMPSPLSSETPWPSYSRTPFQGGFDLGALKAESEGQGVTDSGIRGEGQMLGFRKDLKTLSDDMAKGLEGVADGKSDAG